MSCGIYIITEIDTGRQYIGQSTNIEERWKKHRRTRFASDQFSYELLIECPKESLDFFEISFISGYNTLRPNGFNVQAGGQDWKYCNTPESRKKKSEAAKKQWAEKREKMMLSLNPHRGPQSEETKKRKSEITKKQWEEKREAMIKSHHRGPRKNNNA